MMNDVTAKVASIISKAPLPDGDPSTVLTTMKSQALDLPGAQVLDDKSPDGITIKSTPFNAAQYAPDGKFGQVFVFERDTGDTRLFFVWVPPYLIDGIRKDNVDGRFNFHVLFHPPTYEECYKNTPYWDGACTRWQGEGCDDTMQDKPLYLKLGLRYLSTDFRAIAQHFSAGAGPLVPNLMYVVPVADIKNFSDLVQPPVLMTVLGEIIEGVVSAILNRPVSFRASSAVGKIVISGYSRSGTRLPALFSSLASEKVFFTEHLNQVNAFDIVLGEQSDEKIYDLWLAMMSWRRAYPNAGIAIYSAYATPAGRMLREGPGARLLTTRKDVNFETVTWTDPKPPLGAVRGSGFEASSSDGRVRVILIPISFFKLYIINNSGPIQNPRGYDHKKTGHFHGHGWFLRSLMSHALSIAAAEPGLYAKRPPAAPGP